MKKMPVWELLIKNGYLPDRKTVESWVIAGNVFVNQDRILKPDQLVDPAGEITVRGLDQKYVSKGGLKLEGALADFRMDIAGAVAIDAGASTGGFTDCLIQHGASKVYAVDVGFGQLAGKLRVHPNVVCMEKVNISDAVLKSLDPRPRLATVDLSYLSLKKAIPVFAQIMDGRGDMICLVKPLFEVEDHELRRIGEISDRGIYRDVLLDLARFIGGLGHRVAGVTHSHVTGNKGTREFFLRVALGNAQEPCHDDAQAQMEGIEKAIAAVMNIPVYKKQAQE